MQRMSVARDCKEETRNHSQLFGAVERYLSLDHINLDQHMSKTIFGEQYVDLLHYDASLTGFSRRPLPTLSFSEVVSVHISSYEAQCLFRARNTSSKSG